MCVYFFINVQLEKKILLIIDTALNTNQHGPATYQLKTQREPAHSLAPALLPGKLAAPYLGSTGLGICMGSACPAKPPAPAESGVPKEGRWPRKACQVMKRGMREMLFN